MQHALAIDRAVGGKLKLGAKPDARQLRAALARVVSDTKVRPLTITMTSNESSTPGSYAELATFARHYNSDEIPEPYRKTKILGTTQMLDLSAFAFDWQAEGLAPRHFLGDEAVRARFDIPLLTKLVSRPEDLSFTIYLGSIRSGLAMEPDEITQLVDRKFAFPDFHLIVVQGQGGAAPAVIVHQIQKDAQGNEQLVSQQSFSLGEHEIAVDRSYVDGLVRVQGSYKFGCREVISAP